MVGFLLSALLAPIRSRLALQAENLALRHQLAVYQRTCTRPRLKPVDRVIWSWLSRIYSGWRDALVIVQPQTVIAWRRRKFQEHWTKLIRSGKQGRPAAAKEVRDLIRRVSSTNSLWGSPRILGELSRIGIVIAKSTVEKYMVRSRKPPSSTWKAFLNNHVKDLVAIDFFVVPTVRNQVLFVFLVLVHDRRRVLHFNVTPNPTASGPRSKSSKSSHGNSRRGICFETTTRSMATPSRNEPKTWDLRRTPKGSRSPPHPPRHSGRLEPLRA